MCIRRSDRMLSGLPTSPYKRSQLSIRNLDKIDPTKPKWFYSYLYDNSVHAWYLPSSIAQSRLGATIISVTMAKIIANCNQMFDRITQDTLLNPTLELPEAFLKVMTNSIIEGNEIHRVQMITRRRLRLFPLDTFTIPQAVLAVGHEMHEIDFKAYRGDTWKILPKCIYHGIYHPAMQNVPTITFVVISQQRALLLVFNRKTNIIAVFDTHSHQREQIGAIIAATSLDQLDNFSTYVCSQLFPELLRRKPQDMMFEISCIQRLGPIKNGRIATAINEKIFPRFGLQVTKQT